MGDNSSTKRPRILLVEDNFIVALHLQRGLERLEYEVVGPASGVKEGVALATNADIDAAVLDVTLQDGDCSPIATVLKARSCPFLFATGHSDPPFGEGRWAEVLVMLKPIALSELDRNLQRLLGVDASR